MFKMLSFQALLISLILLTGACKSDSDPQQETETMKVNAQFDVQGHRGARGLLPENTIPSFKKALDLGVNTLELDLVVSADSQVIISHEPWFSHEFCFMPSGDAILKSNEKSHNLFQLTYAEIKMYNCGNLGHPKFKEQESQASKKPSLKDMLIEIEAYAQSKNYPQPRYNMEIKSRPSWDNSFTPEPNRFTKLVLDLINEHNIADRTVVQSFDVRTLEEVHHQNPSQTTAYLVSNNKTVDQNLELLTYIPKIYSPNYNFLTLKDIQDAQANKMKVIPWTVNELKAMKKQIELGVDGIITDYPDRLISLIERRDQ